MSAKKSANPLAAKILAFLDPTTRRTSEEIAEGIGEDHQAVWLELADLEYRDKVLSELDGPRGTPVVRTYRLDGRKPAPKCRHDGAYAIVSFTNWLGGFKGRIGEEGIGNPQILCCACGATRPRKCFNGPSWSQPLAFYESDPLLVRDGWPEGATIFVHATNLRTDEEVERESEKAFAKWVDLDYGRRLLYARLRDEDLPRAERDAAECARTT